MCLFSVYVKAEKEQKLLLDKVCRLEDIGGKIQCVNLFGQTDIIPGKIHLVDTNRARIDILPPQ